MPAVRKRKAGRRVASRIGIGLLIFTGASAARGVKASAELDSFLVPGTRATIVIAEPSFALTSIVPRGTPNRRFGGGDGTTSARFRGVVEVHADDGATRPDGRIVLSGFASQRDDVGTLQTHVAVARFLTSGVPDRGFGDGGSVVTAQRGRGSEIAALSGGALLVAGSTAGRRPMLLRLRPDGSPDHSFGHHGVVVVHIRDGERSEPLEGAVTDIVSRPEGGAILAIHGSFGSGAPESSLLVRYGARGRLDRNFGEGGTLRFGPAGLKPEIYGLVSTRGGRLIALAASRDEPCRIATVGLRAEGRIDPGYGRNGVALGPEVPRFGFDAGLALDTNGAAMVATGVNSHPTAFNLVSFAPTGDWSGFGGPMSAITGQVRGSGPYSIAVRPSGLVLVLSFDVNPPHEPWVAGYRFHGDSSSGWRGPGQ
jgi:uncharacterized delta-60 repeat protein